MSANASRIAELERELAANPDSRQFYQLGELLRREGKPGQAIEVLRRGLVHNPRYVAAWVSLGRACLETTGAGEAAEALEMAIDLDAHNPVAWRLLGEARLASRDRIGALAAMEHCLQLVPGDEVLASAVEALRSASWPGEAPIERPGAGDRSQAPPPEPLGSAAEMTGMAPAELFAQPATGEETPFETPPEFEPPAATTPRVPPAVSAAPSEDPFGGADALAPAVDDATAFETSPFGEAAWAPSQVGDAFDVFGESLLLPAPISGGMSVAALPVGGLVAVTAGEATEAPAVSAAGVEPAPVAASAAGEVEFESAPAFSEAAVGGMPETIEVGAAATSPLAPQASTQAWAPVERAPVEAEPMVEAAAGAVVAIPAPAQPDVWEPAPPEAPAAPPPEVGAEPTVGGPVSEAAAAARIEPRATVRLARLYLQQQQLAEAAAVLERVIEAEPENTEAGELLELVREMMEPLGPPVAPLSVRERKIAALQRWLASLTLGRERAVT